MSSSVRKWDSLICGIPKRKKSFRSNSSPRSTGRQKLLKTQVIFKGEIFMALVNGATYRFQCRADMERSLNVYGNVPTSLANVCLYENNSDDICQQWIYRKSGNHEYLICKGNENLALDLYTGSSSTSNVTNYNAHVYAPSETSYITIEEVSGGYVRIKLDYNGRYLTANQGDDGTSAGKSTHDPGNVYFYAGGLTDYSQDWKPIRLGGGFDPDPDPDPSDGQNLIFPVNNARINTGYKVPIYLTDPSTAGLGEHYGADYVDLNFGTNNIIASGDGFIYRSGRDKNTGYFACIVYPNALIVENGRRVKKDITVRYWHMRALAIPVVSDYRNPKPVSKNDVIGTMGQEGVATGVHLHVECDTDTTPQYTFWTPTHFKSPDILQNGIDTTINPGRVFQIGAGQAVGISQSDLNQGWVLSEDYVNIGNYNIL